MENARSKTDTSSRLNDDPISVGVNEPCRL